MNPSLLPPVYDIDDYHPRHCKDEDDGRPIDFAYRLWGLIDCDDQKRRREDAELFAPEIVVRDLCAFDSSIGNGFAVQLGYSGGLWTFAHGLRAVKAIGAADHLRVMLKAKEVMISKGVRVPTDPDDPDAYADEIDWDTEQAMAKDVGEIDREYWRLRSDVYLILLNHLQAQREILLKRKPKPRT